jgi:hypothetical protein
MQDWRRFRRLADRPRRRNHSWWERVLAMAMTILKTATGAAVVLISVAAGAATQSASHSQVHTNYSHTNYSHPSHYQSVASREGKGLPRSTVAPVVKPAATAGSVNGHSSEVNRLERQSAVQLAAETKHEARPATSTNHIAHSETSARGSGINFAYRSSRGTQTTRSSGSGSRRP